MIKGELFTGEGKAAEFLRFEPYRSFIEEKTGFDPFPGTLNVRSGEAEKIREEAVEHRMEPVEHDGKELGGLTLYSVKVEGEEAAVVDPDLTRYGDDVLEVVASEKLRQKLDLEDGDSVLIEPVG